MINLINVIFLLKTIVEERVNFISSEINDSEREVAEQMFNVLLKCAQNCKVSENQTLVQIHENSDINDFDQIDEEALSFSQSQQNTNTQFSNYSTDTLIIEDNHEKFTFSLEYCRKVIDYVDSHPTSKLSTIRHHFRRIKDANYITRFRDYIKKSGTKIEKLQKLKEFVYNCFTNARNLHLPVHDLNIRRWALQFASDYKILDFTASDFWIFQFKRQFHIASRKITKFVSTNEENVNISELSINFLNNIKPLILEYNPSCVINTDQSGFAYELHSNRTLSNKGEKLTALHICSSNAVSHSYTIQPVISIEGKLLPKFLICLQEQSGKFGPIVFSKLPNYSNVILNCTTSGKLTKELVREFNTVFLKNYIQGNILYIADSWSGQTDSNLYKEIFGERCNFIQIPPHCTSVLQPLDVFFLDFGNYLLNELLMK